jgi:cytochrome P450
MPMYLSMPFVLVLLYTTNSTKQNVSSPDRWDNLPDETQQMPGIFSRLLTFFGGPRACIGYRFALVQ